MTELTFQVAIRTLGTTVHCQRHPVPHKDPLNVATSVMRFYRRLRSSSYEVSGSAVALAVGVILLTDAVMPESGEPVWLVGSLDEIAHLANGVVVLGALGRAVDGRLARGLIGASVLIDIDHIPQHMGADWLTAGTARPYPHSILTLMGASAMSLALRRRARQAGPSTTPLGILIGLSAHFLRDLATPGTGVPLLWPIKKRAFSISHRLYVASLTAGLALSLATHMAKERRIG